MIGFRYRPGPPAGCIEQRRHDIGQGVGACFALGGWLEQGAIVSLGRWNGLGRRSSADGDRGGSGNGCCFFAISRLVGFEGIVAGDTAVAGVYAVSAKESVRLLAAKELVVAVAAKDEICAAETS